MSELNLFVETSMFGALGSAASNSPHLRKSGSRPVFFDIGMRENFQFCVALSIFAFYLLVYDVVLNVVFRR